MGLAPQPRAIPPLSSPGIEEYGHEECQGGRARGHRGEERAMREPARRSSHSSLTEHPEVHVGRRVEGAARQQHHAMGARHRVRLPSTARDAGGDDGDHPKAYRLAPPRWRNATFVDILPLRLPASTPCTDDGPWRGGPYSQRFGAFLARKNTIIYLQRETLAAGQGWRRV